MSSDRSAEAALASGAADWAVGPHEGARGDTSSEGVGHDRSPDMTRTPPRAARTNQHLARVTTLAVAALTATHWLASAAGFPAH